MVSSLYDHSGFGALSNWNGWKIKKFGDEKKEGINAEWNKSGESMPFTTNKKLIYFSIEF